MTDDRITLTCVDVVQDGDRGRTWKSVWRHLDEDLGSEGYGIETTVTFSYPDCDGAADKPGMTLDMTLHVPDDLIDSTRDDIVRNA